MTNQEPTNFKVIETHDDPYYQTSTEPFHIHIGLRRLDNKGYKKLADKGTGTCLV